MLLNGQTYFFLLLKLEEIMELKFPKQTNEMKMDDLHEGAIKAALEN